MFVERAPNLVYRVKENLSFLNGRAVGFDIDAVSQATFFLALQNASRSLNKVILKRDLKSYWHLAKIAESHGMDPERAMEFSKGAWNNRSVYLNSPEMPGIRSILGILNDAEIPYYFVSSRPTEFIDETRAWFSWKFPWVPKEDIILGRKDGVPGGLFKALSAIKYKIGLSVEDAMEEAEIIAIIAQIPVLLVPQPWNDREPTTDWLIKRLGNYSDMDGSWPVLRFLARPEAKVYFDSVAQS